MYFDAEPAAKAPNPAPTAVPVLFLLIRFPKRAPPTAPKIVFEVLSFFLLAISIASIPVMVPS